MAVPSVVIPPPNLTVKNDINVWIDGTQLTDGVIKEIITLISSEDGNKVAEAVDKRVKQDIEKF